MIFDKPKDRQTDDAKEAVNNSDMDYVESGEPKASGKINNFKLF